LSPTLSSSTNTEKLVFIYPTVPYPLAPGQLVSYECLAVMLVVRRQTVTVVAGALQVAGLISYVHKDDPSALEAAARAALAPAAIQSN
jgi:hypothetical protein